jgi:hypothetical protein
MLNNLTMLFAFLLIMSTNAINLKHVCPPIIGGGSPGTIIPTTPANDLVLGTASKYAILAGSTIRTVGVTTVTGSIGTSPGNTKVGTITQLVGQEHLGDANSLAAMTDATTAYTAIAAKVGAVSLDANPATFTIVPGVYSYTSANLGLGGPATITLDGLNNVLSEWYIQISADLKVYPSFTLLLINGASPLNVYWNVAGVVELRELAIISGNIIGKNRVDLASLARIRGRAFAIDSFIGVVTMTTNIIDASIFP